MVDKVIEKYFVTSRSRIRRDNMPVLVRRGNRGTLAKCFGVLGFNIGVEVGTRYGYYAKELCEANPQLHLTCIDPWEKYATISQERQDRIYSEALRNLQPFNITFLRKRSMDALADFQDRSLDFVFIDGAHDFDNVVVDIIYWVHKVKKGGIIAAHDYHPGHGSGVMKAIDAYTHCHSILPWYVTREVEPTAFWINK